MEYQVKNKLMDDINSTHCVLCGKSKNNTTATPDISKSYGSYCSEQCSRTAKMGKVDERNPERAINNVEEKDAYNSNDGQAPLDEAPVEAGGSEA